MSTLQVLYAEVKDGLDNMRKLLIEAEEIGQKEASNVSIRTGGSILHVFIQGQRRFSK